MVVSTLAAQNQLSDARFRCQNPVGQKFNWCPLVPTIPPVGRNRGAGEDGIGEQEGTETAGALAGALHVAALDELDELIHTHSGSADKSAKRAWRKFAVLGYRQACDVSGLHEDSVTASLAIDAPTGAFKGANDLRPGK